MILWVYKIYLLRKSEVKNTFKLLYDSVIDLDVWNDAFEVNWKRTVCVSKMNLWYCRTS